MAFWGVEVKPGKPLKVTPEEHKLIHISKATLGECQNSQKGESVLLYVRVGDRKLVLGTLLSETIPQISYDIVFEKEFELSHNWGKGSVYFFGYTSPNNEDPEGGDYSSDSEEYDSLHHVLTIEDEEEEEVLAAKVVAKPKAMPAEVLTEEDETPKKPESSKKRATETAPKSPVSAKKAKVAATPQKFEEKEKGGHTGTPHQAKKGASATQTPKSANQLPCGSCNKTFNSTNALESHNKAKHSAAK